MNLLSGAKRLSVIHITVKESVLYGGFFIEYIEAFC